MTLGDVEVALRAVRAGAEIVRRDYGNPHVRTGEGLRDLVTQTDLDAERAILDVLAQERPQDAVHSEELGERGRPACTRRWLVDPLCGTVNFAATTPGVAVNVALAEGRSVTVAAVADPVAGELFWTDGERSFTRRARDGRSAGRAVPSSAVRLVEVNCDGPPGVAFVGGQLVADPRLRAILSPRVTSSTLALAWTAVGRRAAYVSDGSFDNNVHYAAPIAVCRDAGCLVSDLAGEALDRGRGLVVSADNATHEVILEMIAPHVVDVLGSS